MPYPDFKNPKRGARKQARATIKSAKRYVDRLEDQGVELQHYGSSKDYLKAAKRKAKNIRKSVDRGDVRGSRLERKGKAKQDKAYNKYLEKNPGLSMAGTDLQDSRADFDLNYYRTHGQRGRLNKRYAKGTIKRLKGLGKQEGVKWKLLKPEEVQGDLRESIGDWNNIMNPERRKKRLQTGKSRWAHKDSRRSKIRQAIDVENRADERAGRSMSKRSRKDLERSEKFLDKGKYYHVNAENDYDFDQARKRKWDRFEEEYVVPEERTEESVKQEKELLNKIWKEEYDSSKGNWTGRKVRNRAAADRRRVKKVKKR